jgi:anaerobic sulfite reductase subunit C
MRWSKEAEEAISKVPFFVRKRVRKRVEEEATSCGAAEVAPEHVRTCQRRFLNRMEDEVRGFQVETCFGPTGCPNRAVNRDISQEVEEFLKKRNLKEFLREKVRGPLKMHHEFRVSISDCPNACSRPQIADLGLIGACRPSVSDQPCSHCGACLEICREEAITLKADGPEIVFARCLSCGKCISSCPTGTLKKGTEGYRVQVGGKLGRHPRLAEELPGIYGLEEALRMVNRCVDLYQKHCSGGERLGGVLEKTGIKEIPQ